LLHKRRSQSALDGLREFGVAKSHARSKDKDRGMAGRMHEGRMHEGKPPDISDSRQRNSFPEAVHSAERAVQKGEWREADSNLSCCNQRERRRFRNPEILRSAQNDN